MQDAKDLIPWVVTDISIRPFEGYWSFNPSIHFDGVLWRCVLRCCDYAMPDGVTVRSNKALMGQQTKNAMVIFDPKDWAPIQIYKMHERDDLPRAPTPHAGYEDMRLFKTDAGGLQGIAASLHLKRGANSSDVSLYNPLHNQLGPQNQPPEQVVLSFDDDYNIVTANPIRGGGWSGTPQKNWVPFDDCAEPRFLYSIGKGTMFDAGGSVHGNRATARPSIRSASAALPVHCTGIPPLSSALSPPTVEAVSVLGEERKSEEPGQDDLRGRPRRPDLRTMIRGGDVRIVRGKRAGTAMSAPSRLPLRPAAVTRGGDESIRVMGTGRTLLPRYEGLRGGTQLVRVDEEDWLGIGHEMKFVNGKKYYWHVFYLVDSQGVMKAVSEPMKLAANGIEFAAGMAVDGDRIVVSFGVDDMASRLGETRLSAVMEKLQKINQ
jgi:hypothetical protein